MLNMNWYASVPGNKYVISFVTVAYINYEMWNLLVDNVDNLLLFFITFSPKKKI